MSGLRRSCRYLVASINSGGLATDNTTLKEEQDFKCYRDEPDFGEFRGLQHTGEFPASIPHLGYHGAPIALGLGLQKTKLQRQKSIKNAHLRQNRTFRQVADNKKESLC